MGTILLRGGLAGMLQSLGTQAVLLTILATGFRALAERVGAPIAVRLRTV